MPTNFIRRPADPEGRAVRTRVPPGERIGLLTVDQNAIRIAFSFTRTAEIIWHALPLFSIAETWGESLHFEVPVRSGRDRTARINARPGDILFWADDDRIVLAWGPTPISRDHEIRLMRPCNVWAHALDDPSCFQGTVPGVKVTLARGVWDQQEGGHAQSDR